MPGAELRGVTLDCADPQTLAGFYGALTGMRELFSSEDFAALTDGPGCDLGFQRVDGYKAPQWPGQDVPQQFHIDFRVEDLDAMEAQALELDAFGLHRSLGQSPRAVEVVEPRKRQPHGC